MPGFKTHSLFGIEAVKSLESSRLKNHIAGHNEVFQMGCQGPDFIFYFLPSHFYGKNYGDTLHTTKVSLFFKELIYLREKYPKSEIPLIDSYIAGFFSHYILDSAIHPYIYYRTKHMEHQNEHALDFGNHSSLETDIDQVCLSHYLGIQPLDFRPWKRIAMNERERTIIASFMARALNDTYPEIYCSSDTIRNAMRAMQLEQRLMYDPKGLKKKILDLTDYMICHHVFISSMVPYEGKSHYSDPCNTSGRTWENPFCPSMKSRKSVFNLFNEAKKQYLDIIELFIKTCEKQDQSFESDLHRTEYENSLSKLLLELGNNSYLTGLPL
ncbi:MAG: zinc dependent phospholipase C family protein [Lachnospiraceae bacterium]|nr:zinc dependent phospholipase C family protein [Lachnospiraceae bacterium]